MPDLLKLTKHENDIILDELRVDTHKKIFNIYKLIKCFYSLLIRTFDLQQGTNEVEKKLKIFYNGNFCNSWAKDKTKTLMPCNIINQLLPVNAIQGLDVSTTKNLIEETFAQSARPKHSHDIVNGEVINLLTDTQNVDVNNSKLVVASKPNKVCTKHIKIRGLSLVGQRLQYLKHMAQILVMSTHSLTNLKRSVVFYLEYFNATINKPFSVNNIDNITTLEPSAKRFKSNRYENENSVAKDNYNKSTIFEELEKDGNQVRIEMLRELEQKITQCNEFKNKFLTLFTREIFLLSQTKCNYDSIWSHYLPKQSSNDVLVSLLP